MMNTRPNFTEIQFGIQSPTKRYMWASYHIFVIISVLVGDSLILVAATHKEAFKVKKFIVVVIQHIAVGDLLNAIITVLPASISLVSNDWEFGDTLCFVRGYSSYGLFYIAGSYLTMVLTVSKFLFLKCPLRASHWSTTRAHLACSFTWAYAVIAPTLIWGIYGFDAGFDYRFYNCVILEEQDSDTRVIIISGFICSVVINIIIVTATFPTLNYLAKARRSARQVKGTVPWQGAVTVSLTSIVACVSTAPLTAYTIIKPFLYREYRPWTDLHLCRMGVFIMTFGIMSNFYIYAMSMKSFRKFLIGRFHRIRPMTNSSNETSA